MANWFPGQLGFLIYSRRDQGQECPIPHEDRYGGEESKKDERLWTASNLVFEIVWCYEEGSTQEYVWKALGTSPFGWQWCILNSRWLETARRVCQLDCFHGHPVALDYVSPPRQFSTYWGSSDTTRGWRWRGIWSWRGWNKLKWVLRDRLAHGNWIDIDTDLMGCCNGINEKKGSPGYFFAQYIV